MNVKNKLKSRAVKFIQGKDDSKDQDDNLVSDEEKAHNLKTELFNIFQIALCFFLLFGGFNTMSQLLVWRSRLEQFYVLHYQGLIYVSVSEEVGHNVGVNPFIV